MEKSFDLLKRQFDEIVSDYLMRVSSLSRHDHFSDKSNRSSFVYSSSKGFSCISSGNVDNSRVVKEEVFLEGCTRVYLVNPFFKCIMDMHGIENDWFFGQTFGNCYATNLENEMENVYEFIAVFNDKKVGVRYARPNFALGNMNLIYDTSGYEYRRVDLFGFNKINSVDIIQYLDWSGISEEDLKQTGYYKKNHYDFVNEMSVKNFFDEYFSRDEYDLFISVTKDAVRKARDIIALNAIPQLLPNNILSFKHHVLEKFDEKIIDSIRYVFKNGKTYDNCMSTSDVEIIKEYFYLKNYRTAIIGDSDFAESFITSEYLFQYIKSGLCIDYTAILVGYLKTIEQLLYRIYSSSFEGEKKLRYWDTWHKKGEFDLEKDSFRMNPYDVNGNEKYQENYAHTIKKPEKIEMGELNRFIRYHNKTWRISENGKEYVFKCLEDFRDSCRNSHFHKDNIDAEQYNQVLRIRNNTYICLYYLLGGFDLLDSHQTKEQQLGIIDYQFEKIYSFVREKGQRYYFIQYPNGTEHVIYYLNRDSKVEYNKNGILPDAELYFLKINKKREDVVQSDAHKLLLDSEYVGENLFVLSRDNASAKFGSFYPKRDSQAD